jgi:hypothetical protein
MMILFVKLTKGIGHKFYQLMKSSPNEVFFQLNVVLTSDNLAIKGPWCIKIYTKLQLLFYFACIV